jgi:hypothetical protein
MPARILLRTTWPGCRLWLNRLRGDDAKWGDIALTPVAVIPAQAGIQKYFPGAFNRLPQLFHQNLVDDFGVGLAFGFPHDLANKKSHEFGFTVPVSYHFIPGPG